MAIETRTFNPGTVYFYEEGAACMPFVAARALEAGENLTPGEFVIVPRVGRRKISRVMVCADSLAVIFHPDSGPPPADPRCFCAEGTMRITTRTTTTIRGPSPLQDGLEWAAEVERFRESISEFCRNSARPDVPQD